MPRAAPFTADNQVALPLLRTEYQKTYYVAALTTTPTNAQQLFTDAYPRPIRIWAIGCELIYVTGGSGVAAPTNADGYVGKDARVEIYLDPSESYIRIAAASGSGSVRVEVLR